MVDSEQPRDNARELAEDTACIERTKTGDAEAFGALVARHMRRAFAVSYRVMQHREDAEDLVQEAFIAALEAIDSFESGRPFGPWLHRIVVNRGLNARRAAKSRRAEPLDAEPASAASLPDEVVLLQEEHERLQQALAGLPDRQRMILELFELDGFTSREIAEMLGIPEGTVRWHVHQARKTLSGILVPREGKE
ncbi:MAG: RNA polymerase sigma factor [Candidatus Schekmanbacteria bacterium]|nr:RNA polymerase sigma factor [Candidatus Schekmanbacteria bacterium]